MTITAWCISIARDSFCARKTGAGTPWADSFSDALALEDLVSKGFGVGVAASGGSDSFAGLRSRFLGAPDIFAVDVSSGRGTRGVFRKRRNSGVRDCRRDEVRAEEAPGFAEGAPSACAGSFGSSSGIALACSPENVRASEISESYGLSRLYFFNSCRTRSCGNASTR